jgi:hypothetical protein
VAIALGQSRAIFRAIDVRPPSGSTPTADALGVAHRALREIRTPGSSQAIVLATDGGPNCNPRDRGEPWYGLGPETCEEAGFDVELCLDDDRTLDAIAAAAAERIPTYVVGMDMRVEFQVDLLNRMAVAGGVPVTGTTHQFYDVGVPSDLTVSLRAIGDRVARCTFVPRTDIVLETGELTIDGRAIPMDETDGWTSTPAGIELHGPTCDRARRPGARVRFLPFC